MCRYPWILGQVFCFSLIVSAARADLSAATALAASKDKLNQALVALVQKLPRPVAYIFAKKYIAGAHLPDAVTVIRKLNTQGVLATLDILGEAVTNKKESVRVKEGYLKTLDAINKNHLESNISIKPTHFMLTSDPEFCFQQISELLARAQKYNNFVRIDMENSGTTDATLALYKRLHQTYTNVGIVVQANLRRTLTDIQSSELKDTNYRLCKGVYKEANTVAFNDPALTRKNFLTIVKYFFEHGNYVAIATHDDTLVQEICALAQQYNVARDKFEFQTLYGVREDLRDKMVQEGYTVRVYVPYGKNWYPYAMRRLQESKNVAGLLLMSLLSAIKIQ